MFSEIVEIAWLAHWFFYNFWKHKWNPSLILQGNMQLLVYNIKGNVSLIKKVKNHMLLHKFIGSQFSIPLASMNWKMNNYLNEIYFCTTIPKQWNKPC